MFAAVEFTEAYYYVSITVPHDILPGIDLSAHIPYELADYLNISGDVAIQSKCDYQCDDECHEFREFAMIDTVSDDVVDEAVACEEDVPEGECLFLIEDGLPNEEQNRKLICGCHAL